MCQVMRENKDLIWKLFAPSYSDTGQTRRPNALAGLSLPWDRIETGNLPLDRLADEMASSKMLLASLGGEDGGITYLDGHAAGIPVLSGDDIMAKYWNPEGTGIRCTTWRECLRAIQYLLNNEKVAAEMGARGRAWVKESFSENYQRICLRQIMEYLEMQQRQPFPRKETVQSDKKFSLRYKAERLEIRLATLFGKWMKEGAR